MAICEPETLKLSDGASVEVVKTPAMTADEWKETKSYLEANPEEGKKWETFSKDASAIKTFMQQQAISAYYQSKLNAGNEVVATKLLGLEGMGEFAHVFDAVRRGGSHAALQSTYNEPLMMKINRAVGGLPDEVKQELSSIKSSCITLHEACKLGDAKVVEAYINSHKGLDLEAKDAKGISCLGYAVGANRIAVVKLLLSAKANPSDCDSNGGTAVHYAAAYGRKELLEFLIQNKLSVNTKNKDGLTPLALATKNKQKDTIDLLKSKGAEM